jgi:hypothetical protein
LDQYAAQFDGFRQILKSEGFKGLYRGSTAAIPRVAVRSISGLVSTSGQWYLTRNPRSVGV